MGDRGLSLRKKILLLALLPAALACIIFALLVLNSGRRASTVVRSDVNDFMVKRTEKSLNHADRSAAVTSYYVGAVLRSQQTVAQLLIASRGGVGLGLVMRRTLISDGTHVGGSAQVPALRVGAELLGDGNRSDIAQQIAHETNATVIIFERLIGSGELVRVASTSPQAQVGTFLQSHSDEAGKPAPDATLVAGDGWFGRTEEAGAWHLGRYEPLRDSKGTVVGALYLGIPVDSITLLAQELAANAIGNKGSVDLFYAHGAEKGKSLLHPFGITVLTRPTWFPRALERAPMLQPGQQEGFVLQIPGTRNDAIVRYSYLQQFDWVLVVVADSEELSQASIAVGTEFHNLVWFAILDTVVVLGLIAIVASVYSRRIVDPLMEITIQLTSNGTQVASSARQQLDNATNFNASSTEIATAVKQISSTSKELLRAMEDLSQEASRASAVAQEGSTGLQGLSSSIEQLSTATHHITDSLKKIRDRATRINTVTLAVTKVADQTNLLSLNAAIEAEKAGEAGAGFGVVAREVRRLADQSAQSSLEIEETVLEMQDAVSAGVQQVQSLAVAMQNGIAATERINQQFSEIIARVEAMTPRYERVHIGMQNQTEGAQQISEAMWQLTESAGATTDAVAELNGVSNELHSAVRVLKQRIFEGGDDA